MLFHIDLDAFFAAVEVRDNPTLRGKPVIIGGSKALANRGVVSTASYEARTYGIHSGMALVTARRLCPHGVYMVGNFAKYRRVSRQFIDILQQYTHDVETTSVDEAYCSFYGFERYYGDFVQLADRIKRDITATIGITATVGIATNKQVAKIASDTAKPDGLRYVAAGIELQFLADLPVSAIPGVGVKLTLKLHDYNIRTIGQLARLPRETAVLLFGKHGEYLYRIAHGHGTVSLELNRSQKSVGRETTFARNSSDPVYIRTLLLYLSDRVAYDLRSKCLTGTCITLKLRTGEFVTMTHQRTIAQPTNTAQTIYRIACQLFDEVRSVATLRLLGVSVSGFADHAQQLSLFAPQTDKHRLLEQTMDSIRHKYGFLGVFPAQVVHLKHGLRRTVL